MRQVHLAGVAGGGPSQLGVALPRFRRQVEGAGAGRLAGALRGLAEGDLAAPERGPGEAPRQILGQGEVVGVAHDHQDAFGRRAPPGAQGDRLRVLHPVRGGALGGERKRLRGLAAGQRHRGLQQLDEDPLHEVVFVADQEQQRPAAADRQAVGRLARAEHLLRRPGERRRVVESQRGADAGQVAGRELRGHRPDGMPGDADAAAVEASGEQTAQVAVVGGPRRGGGAQGGQRGPAGAGGRAEQAHGAQDEARVGHPLAEQVAHHRVDARHAARDDRRRGRVEVLRRREPPPFLSEQQTVEVGHHLDVAQEQVVRLPQFLRRRVAGERRILVVKHQRQAAVGHERGRRHDVAVGGEELAQRAPRGVAAGEPVQEEDHRERPLGGRGVLPGVLPPVENPAPDVGERGVPDRGRRRGQGAAARQVDELRQHHLRRGADPPRQVAGLEEEVEVVRAPPGGGREGGARPGEPAAGGVRRRGIPQLERHRPGLSGRLHAPQQRAVLGSAVGAVPGVETPAVVHREAGGDADGVAAVDGPRRQCAQRRRLSGGRRGRERGQEDRAGQRDRRRASCPRARGRHGWWRRRESNPRPKVRRRRNLHAYPPLNVSLPASKGGGNRRKPSPDASRRRVSVPRATTSPLYDA